MNRARNIAQMYDHECRGSRINKGEWEKGKKAKEKANRKRAMLSEGKRMKRVRVNELRGWTVFELKEKAKAEDVKGRSRMTKEELIHALV